MAFTPCNENGVAELTITDGQTTEHLTASAPLAKGEWSKITIRIIDGKGTLLINGSQAASSSLSLTPLAVMSAAQDDYAFLGKGMTDRNFKGAVDYTNFYFKEVAEPQITYSGSEAADDTDLGVSDIRGDVNADGQFSIADLVMMQKYLIRGGTLTDWQQGDLYEDGLIDAKDLVLMKRLFMEQA